MEDQVFELRGKPSIRIPPSLLISKWSHRHGPETYQQNPDVVQSPSVYSSENSGNIQRGYSIKRLPGNFGDWHDIRSGTHLEAVELSSGQDGIEDRPAFGRHAPAYNQPNRDVETGLYSNNSHPYMARRSSNSPDSELHTLSIQIPERPRTPEELHSQHDDAALLHSSRRQPKKRSSLAQTPIESAQAAIQGAASAVSRVVRRTSTWRSRREALRDMQGYAKIRNQDLERHSIIQIIFQIAFYLVLVAVIYFVFVGVPLWKGTTFYLYQLLSKVLVLKFGYTIFIGISFIYAFLPLLTFFEADPETALPLDDPKVKETALIIPCYKSASLIEKTIKAALKVFPARNIFVIANGNSPDPLDNTADIVMPYGVNHVWSPVGSKIVAQFVGCYAAEEFKYVLLIDDDCLLPPNFPIASDRIKDNIKCLGYTIKSVGPDATRGTFCQQAQDLEYKLSGLQRALAGKLGSCTFAHGAINLWDRKFLIQTFQEHPGFSVSEDWFFGHAARKLGSRITMCTSVFVETETPSAIFMSNGGSRGGFGEMTIWKQRFFRWNFFFVTSIFYNMGYILFSWKLGFWEIGTKFFVWQEVYETMLYILAPFVLPMSFMISPAFTAIMMGATTAMYLVNAVIFNEIHLRRKKERVTWACIAYYMWYKFILTFVNILSCYWSILKYAQYFAVRHPKVIEDVKALDVVLSLDGEDEEEKVEQSEEPRSNSTNTQPLRRGMSIRTQFTTPSDRVYRETYSAWKNSIREPVREEVV